MYFSHESFGEWIAYWAETSVSKREQRTDQQRSDPSKMCISPKWICNGGYIRHGLINWCRIDTDFWLVHSGCCSCLSNYSVFFSFAPASVLLTFGVNFFLCFVEQVYAENLTNEDFDVLRAFGDKLVFWAFYDHWFFLMQTCIVFLCFFFHFIAILATFLVVV